MKKNFLSMAVLAAVFTFTSCGSKSSFENDVRKFADFQCEMKKLEAKDQNDEKVKMEIEKLEKEMEDYGNKMKEKYKDKKDDKAMNDKADKIMKEVMDKCK